MATTGTNPDGSHRKREDQLARAVYGHPAPANPSTDGNRQGLWQTPDVPNGGRSLPAGTSITGMTLDGEKKQVGLHNQVKAWSTPQAHDAIGRSDTQREKHGTTHGCRCLVQDVKAWRTPSDPTKRGGSQCAEKRKAGGHTVNLEDQVHHAGKLNPRWVETLMGLPVGWVMPSCASPVTIAPTNSASSATESCQP